MTLSAARRAAPLRKAAKAVSPERKLSARIAEEIEDEVIRSGWPVGRFIGSEAELLERFNVSRATLREAIRQLEAHGIAKTRRGSGGGLIVGENPLLAAERALAIYLELINVEADELFEARAVLEPFAASLAADRGAEETAARLRELLHALTSPKLSMAKVVGLHVEIRHTLGLMSANPALSMFVGALNRFTVEAIANEITASFNRADSEEPLRSKARIIDAVIARNGFAAEQAMQEDIASRRRVLANHFRTHARRQVFDARALLNEDSPLLPKRAQLLAIALAHDIQRRGLKTEERIGAEADLLAQFGVSRAIFREAMRLLELHGFVRTRRGHGGGLLVSEPSSAYAIKAAESYLRYAQMDRRHFPEVRGRLAVDAAQLAAERATRAQIGTLKALLERVIGAGSSDIIEASVAFHGLIGALSGNRALALFINVLLHLNRRPNVTKLPGPIEARLRENSQKIFDAIAAKDPNMARRRMVEHMQDVEDWAANGMTVFK